MVAQAYNEQYDDLLFDSVEQINSDRDYWFQLRGDNPNVLIDAATPLFGLALRVRSLTSNSNIDEVYNQTVEEIQTIEVEIGEKGFEHAVIMAYRYILCAFLDEAVMGTEWGASSVWAEFSMLSRFHNETWGGEKVYTILARLETEPKRYQPLLEFIYHCLVLGFEGKYRVMDNGKALRERVISGLYELLHQLSLESESQTVLEPQTLTTLTDPRKHVVDAKYTNRRKLPVWSIFVGFAVFWLGVYLGYTWILHSKSADIVTQLNQLL